MKHPKALQGVRNLLYDCPELYELAYPEPNDETPAMCRRAFGRFLKNPPGSILDLGCGTGRDLRSLRRDIPDCVGVDLLPQVIDYARSRAADTEFRVGDIRKVRLGRSFDAVCCFGSALLYALSDGDLAKMADTFAAHCHRGSLLLIDIRNPKPLLGAGFRPRIEGSIESAGFSARYVSEHHLDRVNRRLRRRRTWHLADGATVGDYCEYRLLSETDLRELLEPRGFEVLGIFDNRSLREGDTGGPTLYAVGRYR